MRIRSIHEATARPNELVSALARHGPVLITRGGKPCAAPAGHEEHGSRNARALGEQAIPAAF